MKRLVIAALIMILGCGGSGGSAEVTVNQNQNQTFTNAYDCFQFCGESEKCVEHYGCAALPDESAQSN